MSETALSFAELKKSLIAEAKKRLIKAEDKDLHRQRISNAQDSNISAMTMAERRAIFEEKVNERLPEIIAKLPPRYIAKNRQKIELAIQKAEKMSADRRHDSLETLSDSVRPSQDNV
jgi:hypothetical protein